MTYFDWFRTIAAALNDDEPGMPFQRYALKDMFAAYNAAICLAGMHRPDLFTSLRIVRLQPGHWQDVRGCCSNVTDVLEQTDELGNIIKPLDSARETDTKVKRIWKKPTCRPAPTDEDGEPIYIVDSVELDKNLPGRFRVDPPVPCDAEAYVRVKCVNQPCAVDEASQNGSLDGSCIHNTAAWHYVLARMRAGDRHDNAASGEALEHYRLFFDILGIERREHERLMSPQEA